MKTVPAGLRHLPLVDEGNRVVGILTRKDLMGFNVEHRLAGGAGSRGSIGNPDIGKRRENGEACEIGMKPDDPCS